MNASPWVQGETVEIKERLATELANGRLVIIAGTGVTTGITDGAPTSGWGGLIDDGIRHVEKRDPDTSSLLQLRMEKATSAEDLVGIAHDLKRYLGKDFGRWIAQSVGELPCVKPDVPTALAALGAPILTTNYDDLLEKILSRPSATWHRPSDMRRVLLQESVAIGHLHGVWTDIDSVIFSQGDYQTITENADAQSVQTGAFALKTFLFVGVGDGLTDPNFSPMIKAFGDRFPTSAHPHYRLCLNSKVDPTTELKTVVDVGFGDTHDDLASFLLSLAPTADHTPSGLGPKSRSLVLDALRDNSTLWRDNETLSEKSVADLVVPPIFLPEPHDQYATNAVLNAEKDKPGPVDLSEKIRDGGIILIAGEESSGVSTAVNYCLTRALDLRANAHVLLAADPMVSGANPIGRVIERSYRSWGVESPSDETRKLMALGVDNLRFDGSTRFDRAMDDIAESVAGLKVVGVRQNDAVDIANLLKERTGEDVTVVYLGRFSNVEARELARRVAPGREAKVAEYVMVVIREKNLPRTPFTITLLVDLVQSGILLQKQESEIAVLDQYLDLLLNADLPRTRDELSMTLRNKRLVLEILARRLVQDREDKAPESDVLDWLKVQFEELGWDYNVTQCVNDLVARRVLARSSDNTIRFQRSAYLELMAGIAARDDAEFRQLVFESPIQLASIVRSYAAMTRNAKDVLDVVEREIERIAVSEPSGAIFSSVRKVEARKELFSDERETEAEGDNDEADKADNSVEREGLTGHYYDDSDDSDTPAFLVARIEDLSQSRVAMLVVDLASRVLRDSDEVRDQGMKDRILRKLLVAWVGFTDLHETEISSLPDLDDIISSLLDEEDARTPEDIEKLKHFLTRMIPTVITASGVRYCLSGPSLVTRLVEVDMTQEENGSYGSMIRTLALYGTKSRRWIETLKLIDDDAVKTFFSASFLASIARYAYITDKSLEKEERVEIRNFLRRVISARYKFDGVKHRSDVLSKFETKLNRDRLEKGRRKQGIEIEA